MGKWLARLVALDDTGEENGGAPFPSGCRNCQNPLVSVLAVGREGSSKEFSGAANGDDEPAERFARVRARLLSWGWPAPEAEAMAQRLARRHAEGDDRVTCAGDCAHYRPGRCGNHRRAGLYSADVGRDLAGLLQCCPGFQLEG